MTAQRQALWQPREPWSTNVAKFIIYVNQKHGLHIQTYEQLWEWSTADVTLQDFWGDAYDFLELAPPGHARRSPMLSTSDSPRAAALFPPPRFFASETLNIAEIMFRNRNPSDVAIYFACQEEAPLEIVTWGELRERVRQARSALQRSGVGRGDVVAAVISNSVHATVLALAVASLGAIWSSSSCDLGVHGIVDRYRQIHPKIVFADEGYVYGPKTFDLKERIATWAKELLAEPESRLKDVVVIGQGHKQGGDVSSIPAGCSFSGFLARDGGDKLAFDLVPFTHPGFILFSSGTTGIPKCIVHSVGGVALKVKTDFTLQHDIRREDTIFQYTTTSWIMWTLNLLNLSCSSSTFLYEGSPFYPRPTILLEYAAKLGVCVFGTSPKYLGSIKSMGIKPREQFDLSKMRVMTSTGSTLSPELYSWFYETAFPPSVHLASMSGGTDIAGSFVGGSPLLPVYSGEIQCRNLGMAVNVFDSAASEGTPVAVAGDAGELVCVKPFPSQPLTFIGKDGTERYRKSYFERFGDGVWCQGDYVSIAPDTGGIMMLGRSDGVLNPSGVRFGSSEIYAVTETFPAIEDSICVGQRRQIDEDERVLLFIKMQAGKSLSDDLVQNVRAAIKAAYSPRHVPKFIFQVDDIPYTVNGKKCEINVKNIVCCRTTAASGTVTNPEALKLYEKYQKLPAEKEQTRAKAKL